MKKLQKLLAILTGVVLALSFSVSCTAEEESGAVVEPVEEATASEEQREEGAEKSDDDKSLVSEKGEVTVDEQVLLNLEGIIITLKSLSTDSIWGPSLKVLVENNRDEDITVQIRNSAINGVMIESMFSCDVAAGKRLMMKLLLCLQT